MAPNFALFLSPEGIALAHRQPGGHWAVLGDTALDVPDLGASLLVLRKLAEQRAGKDFETLVILPDDQVLYTSLTAPGPDEADRLEQIRDGLDGLTPYPVDQLVFDWFPLEDGRVKLAVVAQETLDEARAFASGHGFTPAGFGARPLDNRYRGVAHFDRSIDWTADIEDIEFGHDTWHNTPSPAAPDAGETAPDAESTGDAPATEEEAPAEASAAPAPEAPDPPVPEPAVPDPDVQRIPEPDATPQAGEASSAVAASTTTAPPAVEVPDPPRPSEPSRPAAEPEAEVESEATPSSASTPEAAPPEAPKTGAASEGPASAADAPLDPLQGDAHETSPTDAPLEVPVGFGSGRKRAQPEAAGSLVRTRKSRFGPGAAASAAEGAATDPALPRAPKPDGGARPEPVFGRAARKDAAGRAPATAEKATPPAPARPQGAGPEPQLPPLARLKSQIAARPPQDRPAPGPNPFAGPPPSLSGEKSTLKDRMAGIGRQLSASTGKARQAASDLSGRMTSGKSALGSRLRALGRDGTGDAPAASATATEDASQPQPDTAPSPPPAAPKKTQQPGRSDKKTGPQSGRKKKKAEPAEAAAQSAAPAQAIAPPPPAEKPRRRFSPPKRGRAEPRIADADAAIMGGLLARGSVATSRGPSVRTGLILTLILLAVLGLIGIWAAFYLPQTALGRWMGLGTPEEVIIADTAPEVLDTPLLTAPSPSAEDAPEVMASLTPEEAPPAPALTAPPAPELLPDIDAEDLDLGPAPVASPVIDPETVLPSEEENANFYARTGIWQRPPVITLPDPEPVLEEVIFAGLDPAVTTHDAYALTEPDFLPARDLPRPEVDPGLPASLLALDPDNMVPPTPEGAMTPYGILVYAGTPPVPAVPRPRDAPEVLAAAAAEAAAVETVDLATGETPDATGATEEPGRPPPGAVDTALLQANRPTARPADLQEQRERAVLGGITFDELARIRPESRPVSLQEQAEATAAANADTSPGDLSSASDLAVAVSFLPRARPGNIEQLVEGARAAGNSGPVAPVAANTSDTIQPDIPSSASVTRAATQENGINLRHVNLIGVSGSSGSRRALVRLPSGRFVTVEVGDRLDGGQVAAIGESSLQYVKRGRTITLDVPAG